MTPSRAAGGPLAEVAGEVGEVDHTVAGAGVAGAGGGDVRDGRLIGPFGEVAGEVGEVDEAVTAGDAVADAGGGDGRCGGGLIEPRTENPCNRSVHGAMGRWVHVKNER